MRLADAEIQQIASERTPATAIATSAALSQIGVHSFLGQPPGAWDTNTDLPMAFPPNTGGLVPRTIATSGRVFKPPGTVLPANTEEETDTSGWS